MTTHQLVKGIALAGAGLIAAHFAPRPLKAVVLGNAPQYSPDQVTLNPASPLFGKHVGYLGSSIDLHWWLADQVSQLGNQSKSRAIDHGNVPNRKHRTALAAPDWQNQTLLTNSL